MVNYLSSMTQLAPLLFASAATAPEGLPNTTLTLTVTWNNHGMKPKLKHFWFDYSLLSFRERKKKLLWEKVAKEKVTFGTFQGSRKNKQVGTTLQQQPWEWIVIGWDKLSMGSYILINSYSYGALNMSFWNQVYWELKVSAYSVSYKWN